MDETTRRLFNLTVWIVPVVILAAIILPLAIRILREYERATIFRLGKLLGVKGPGLIILVDGVDGIDTVDTGQKGPARKSLNN
jgi:regulator of protease activity HflC (stomatin/prohibitin superfamily)